MESTKIGAFLKESRVPGSPGNIARKITVKLYGKGVFAKQENRPGSENTMYYTRRAGQFIYSKLDFLNGAFGIIPDTLDSFETTVDLPCFDFTGDKVAPDWFLHYVSRPDFYAYQGGLGNGGRKARRISPDDFLELEIDLPPLPEQKKIAEILSGIDNLINALTQQKQKLDASKAVLSKKLISGLQGPRKESLYGQIPEHWSESTLGEVVGADNLQTGPFGSQLHAHEYTAAGTPVVMPQDMKKCRVVIEKIARITSDRAQSLEKHKVIPGDILFSRRGEIGRHAIISQKESGWICGTGCLRARTNGAINPFFFSELLMHRYALEWLNANAVGQTMLNLNTRILSELPVVVPPKNEQDIIASTLNSISNRSEKIAYKTLFAQNLKTSLSSDLLSGRKRVTI